MVPFLPPLPLYIHAQGVEYLVSSDCFLSLYLRTHINIVPTKLTEVCFNLDIVTLTVMCNFTHTLHNVHLALEPITVWFQHK